MNGLKRITAMLVIAILGFGAAQAQLRFGIKAGINVNELHFNKDTFNGDNKTGWTAGLMTQFLIPGVGFGFDLSVMYTRLNSNLIEFGNTDLSSTYPNSDMVVLEQNKNFIDVPLNLKYRISLPVVGSIISPYIFTGPAFAFKVGKVKETWTNIETKTCQVNWNVGLGLELLKHLQVGASYGFGINNILKDDSILGSLSGINATDLKAKNNYWTITAAYLF